ncbi:MAG: hypothetical protein ACE37H_08010 [Phycisphaeraceae bacterium]
MLVRAVNHPDKPVRRYSPVRQRRWRLMGIRGEVLDAGDARRRADAASLEAALRMLDGIGGHIEMDYVLHPDRQHQKLDITLAAVIPSGPADRSLADAILRQVESAFSQQHVIARCRPKGARKHGTQAATIVSTIDDACLQPVPGRFSAGQPLQVRSFIDWSMLLIALADLAEPVMIRFRSGAVYHHSLHRNMDEVQRRWQMRQEIARRSGADRRRTYINGEADHPRPRHRPESLTSATRWPTAALQSLAAMTGSAQHLDIRVSADDPGTVLQTAGVVQAAVFESATARVRLMAPENTDKAAPGATISATHPDDLLSMAGTMCAEDGVARVMAGPVLDSPLMYSTKSASVNSVDGQGIALGSRFDDNVDRASDTDAILPLSKLSQHLGVLGYNGSGKSVCIRQLIAECARLEQPLPVTYITLAKNEGPALLGWLKSPDPRLRTYAEQMVFYGLHTTAPLKASINPFGLQDACPIKRAEHAHRVLKSAIALEGPLMGNSLDACLDLCHDMQRHGVMPVIADLPDAIRRVQQALGYGGEILGTIGPAGESRIGEITGGQTGALFRSSGSLPRIEELFARPHCISCGLASEKSTAMFCIDMLLRLEHWLLENPVEADSSTPRLIIIFDEIQVIAPRDPRAIGGDRPTAAIEAAAIIAHCIKTLRALGVAIVFASQHPLSIDAELVKAPGTHLVLAQNQIDERQELAGLIGLTPQQCDQLNGLEAGHGFIRSPGQKRPLRIVVPYLEGVHDCPDLDASALARYCARSAQHRALAIESYVAEMTMREDRLKRAMADLRQDLRRLRDLIQAAQITKTHTDRPDTATQLLTEIRRVAADILRDLSQRSRPIERQWARTLATPPDWLVEWSETTKRSIKQKKQVVELCRRHHRISEAYRRWMARHGRAEEQAKALMMP